MEVGVSVGVGVGVSVGVWVCGCEMNAQLRPLSTPPHSTPHHAPRTATAGGLHAAHRHSASTTPRRVAVSTPLTPRPLIAEADSRACSTSASDALPVSSTSAASVQQGTGSNAVRQNRVIMPTIEKSLQYHMSPIVARVPIGMKYNHRIMISNPHSRPLEVKEVGVELCLCVGGAGVCVCVGGVQLGGWAGGWITACARLRWWCTRVASLLCRCTACLSYHSSSCRFSVSLMLLLAPLDLADLHVGALPAAGPAGHGAAPGQPPRRQGGHGGGRRGQWCVDTAVWICELGCF